MSPDRRLRLVEPLRKKPYTRPQLVCFAKFNVISDEAQRLWLVLDWDGKILASRAQEAQAEKQQTYAELHQSLLAEFPNLDAVAPAPPPAELEVLHTLFGPTSSL